MVNSKPGQGKIVPKYEVSDSIKIKDFLKVFYLKYYKINEDFFEYFREILLGDQEKLTPAGEIKVINQADNILNEIVKNYQTSLEEDEEMIRLAPDLPIKKYFALSKN